MKPAFKRLRAFLHYIRTGEGFFPVHQCPVPPSEAEVIEKQSAWTLSNALARKLETCPAQGAKTQMKNALDQVFRAGSDFLYPDHITREAAKWGNR